MLEEITMELRNLITFIHVAELGSFTKAAEQLGYSQSTISFQIKQLEDELNCLLFERINHTITLTQRGHELVSYAHKVRALTDEFKAYQTQIVKNAAVLCDALKKEDIDIVSGGTDNHVMLVNVGACGKTGKETQKTVR